MPMTRLRSLTFSGAILGFLMITSFLIAALAGASSGIIMLPRKGWWEMNLYRTNATMFKIGDFSGFIVSPVEDLYPKTIDHHSFNTDVCNNATLRELYSCPFNDYLDTESVNWSLLGDVARGDPKVPKNLTSAYKSLAWAEFYPTGRFVWSATTPMQPAVWLLRDIDHWKPYPVRQSVKVSDHQNNPIPLKQPQVSIQCTDPVQVVKPPQQGESYIPGAYSFRLATGLFNPSNPVFEIQSEVLADAYKSKAKFGFIDLEHHSPLPLASATYWISYHMSTTRVTALCFIDARWVESSLWMTPTDDTIPRYSSPIDQATMSARTHSV
ncbi:hypothetical protein QBC35DRAFT_230170 [Podospora australis]|uniref:Uncharacterized protein n=1 Tax=Podospora australis TaxID=1536484 RepID=A0AAN6WI11_9PEZI|nr:hypothetical protein QBC35DRAFT_230170 [Podospora australis]